MSNLPFQTNNIPMYRSVYHYRDFNSSKEHVFMWYTSGFRTAYNPQHVLYTPNAGEFGALDCGMKDIYGNPMYGAMVSGSKEQEIKKAHAGYNNHVSECDIDFRTRFLESHYRNTEQLRFNIDDFNICFLDIEVESGDRFPSAARADRRVNCVTIFLSKPKKYITWGLQKPLKEETVKKLSDIGNFEYRRFDTERELLRDLFTTIGESDIDLISGWHIDGFDIPYLVKRSQNEALNIDLNLLSKVPELYRKGSVYVNKRDNKLNIGGTEIVDYLPLYKKFTKGEKDNYKLNTIAKEEELGEKAPLPEGYKSYINYWDEYVFYNVTDVQLLVEIEKKRRMLESLIGACSEARVPFGHFFEAKKMLVGYLLSFLHKKSIVMPPLRYHEEKKFPGAAVYATPGRYEELVSYDYKSMYPSIMMGANISPETKVTFDINYKLTPEEEKSLVRSPWTQWGKKQVFYRKDKEGIVPAVVKSLFFDRDYYKKEAKKAKKEGRDNDFKYFYMKEQSLKLLGNSLYGLLGNSHFQLYDLDNAASVTCFGYELITSTITHLHSFIKNDIAQNQIYFNTFKENPILNKEYEPELAFQRKDTDEFFKVAKRFSHGDTDSFFVKFDDLYKNFKTKIDKEIGVLVIQGNKIIEENTYKLPEREKESKTDFNNKCFKYCPSWNNVTNEQKKKAFSEGIYSEDKIRIIYNRYWLTDYCRILDAVLMEDLLSDIMQKFSDKWNFKSNTLFLKREKCIQEAIVTTKKKYLCNIESNEDAYERNDSGEKECDFSITGMEIIRSSTLPFAREHIEFLVKKLLKTMDKTDIRERYLNIKQQFYELVKKNDIYSLAIPSGVKENPPVLINKEDDITEELSTPDIENPGKPKYLYVKDIITNSKNWRKVDWRLRAASVWNYLIEQDPSLNSIILEPVSEGSKVKYLKVLPNRYGTNTIAFVGENCPKQLLELFTPDWDSQWEAGFYKVMGRLFEAVGWGKDFENDNRDVMLDIF